VDSVVNLLVDIAGPIGPGRHTVTWQVAGADGHPVRGSFAFTVLPDSVARAPADSTIRPAGTTPFDEHAAHGTDSTGRIPPASATDFDVGSPPFVAVRWLGFAALIATIGSIAFALVIARPLARENAWARDASLLRWAAFTGALGAAGLLAAGILRLIAQSVALNGSSGFLDGSALGVLISDTSWGQAWVVLMAASAIALAALLAAHQSMAWGWLLAAVAALAIATAEAFSGHAAASEDFRAAAIGAHAIHLLAASGWVGGLLMLVTVASRRVYVLPPDQRIAALAGTARAFSPLGLSSAFVLALSGTIAAAIHMRAVGALWETRYGSVLLIKLGLVAVMAGIGWYNWRRVIPALTTGASGGALRRTATSELVVAMLIILVTAVLVAVPPPVELASAIGR
jgi:copper transport protein